MFLAAVCCFPVVGNARAYYTIYCVIIVSLRKSWKIANNNGTYAVIKPLLTCVVTRRYCHGKFLLSVCPSHSWSTPKQFKISIYGLHCTIRWCLRIPHAKCRGRTFRGSTHRTKPHHWVTYESMSLSLRHTSSYFPSKYFVTAVQFEWIYHERGSRHPFTAAVHKWSYKSEETLCLWSCQAYGSSIPCPPTLRGSDLSVQTRQGSGQFGTCRRQPGRPRKCWVDAWSVATYTSAWRALRPVDGQA